MHVAWLRGGGKELRPPTIQKKKASSYYFSKIPAPPIPQPKTRVSLASHPINWERQRQAAAAAPTRPFPTPGPGEPRGRGQATDRTKRSFNFHEERVDSFPFSLSPLHFNRKREKRGGGWLMAEVVDGRMDIKNGADKSRKGRFGAREGENPK